MTFENQAARKVNSFGPSYYGPLNETAQFKILVQYLIEPGMN